MTNPRVTPIWLTFLNYLGGFEYFLMLGEKEFDINITEVGETRQNIFPEWPNSWGENADTIDKKTFTTAKDEIIFRSQHLTPNQRDVLKYIKTSPVVQIVVSRTDRRTILIDSDSFKVYDEADKLSTIQFRGRYTNEIATQRL